MEPLRVDICAVPPCRNIIVQPNNQIEFYNFPDDPALAKAWKEKCGIVDEDTSNSKICFLHFRSTAFIKNTNKLKPDAIPTLFLYVANEKLNYVEVKEAIQQNILLKERLEQLKYQEKELSVKVNEINIKITKEDKAIVKCKKLLKTVNIGYINKANNIITKIFSPAQINVLLGKRKVFWSEDDLARAFTLRHIGSKDCYLYLKNKLNYPLPALSCVQKWMASNK